MPAARKVATARSSSVRPATRASGFDGCPRRDPSPAARMTAVTGGSGASVTAPEGSALARCSLPPRALARPSFRAVTRRSGRDRRDAAAADAKREGCSYESRTASRCGPQLVLMSAPRVRLQKTTTAPFAHTLSDSARVVYGRMCATSPPVGESAAAITPIGSGGIRSRCRSDARRGARVVYATPPRARVCRLPSRRERRTGGARRPGAR